MSEEKKKNSLLSTEISFHGKKDTNYPSKTYINLVSNEQAEQDKKAIGWFLVFLVFLGFFVKFGVYDQLDKLNQAEAEYNLMQSQLAQAQAANADYADIKAQYDKVTDWYMTEEEKMELDKNNVFDMLEEDLMPYVELQSAAISGSTITVQTGVTDLDTVSTFLSKLQADKRNSFVTVTTAAASTERDPSSNLVTASVVITYGADTSMDQTEGGTN